MRRNTVTSESGSAVPCADLGPWASSLTLPWADCLWLRRCILPSLCVFVVQPSPSSRGLVSVSTVVLSYTGGRCWRIKEWAGCSCPGKTQLPHRKRKEWPKTIPRRQWWVMVRAELRNRGDFSCREGVSLSWDLLHLRYPCWCN